MRIELFFNKDYHTGVGRNNGKSIKYVETLKSQYKNHLLSGSVCLNEGLKV